MTEKTRILFLSSNPWTTARILVDEEAREVFEKLQEGSDRDKFELHRHTATRPVDLQRLLMMHEPHIVHFSGHGSLKHKMILGGRPGRGKQVDQEGLVKMFALYKRHVRLVVLNACFMKTQAKALSEFIDYSVGAGRRIGDKEGVAFAGAFYRALSFGKSVTAAFESAQAELALTKMPRTKGLCLFVRKGVEDGDGFPSTHRDGARSAASLMLTKTDQSAVELVRLGHRLSQAVRRATGKPKPDCREIRPPVQVDISRHSSVSRSRSHVSVTVKVFKVSITETECFAHKQASRKDQRVRTRDGQVPNKPTRTK